LTILILDDHIFNAEHAPPSIAGLVTNC